jgi:hypothetical protein
LAALDIVLQRLETLTSKQETSMVTLADIQTAESAEATAISSVVDEIAKLEADLATAQASGADPAAMQAIVDQIHANTAKLTAALPPPTVVAPPPPAPAAA